MNLIAFAKAGVRSNQGIIFPGNAKHSAAKHSDTSAIVTDRQFRTAKQKFATNGCWLSRCQLTSCCWANSPSVLSVRVKASHGLLFETSDEQLQLELHEVEVV